MTAELATLLRLPRVELFESLGSTLDVAHDLAARGAPAGTLIVADAQTAALGIIQRSGAISLVGVPLSFDGARPPLAKLAPRLGEDNPEIVDPAT